MEVQEQLRDTHSALLAALDATHALLLVLAVTPDTPTRYMLLVYGSNICCSIIDYVLFSMSDTVLVFVIIVLYFISGHKLLMFHAFLTCKS